MPRKLTQNSRKFKAAANKSAKLGTKIRQKLEPKLKKAVKNIGKAKKDLSIAKNKKAKADAIVKSVMSKYN